MAAREAFIAAYGGIFEHSPWISERAFDAGAAIEETAAGVHAALTAVFRAASEPERLGVLRAHPDLAGKLAISGGLTQESKAEQASAGLDRLSANEHARFSELNTAYTQKFGFPFIVAVKGLTKEDILSAFETRIDHGPQQEFETACLQVEKIAHLRLQALLPGDKND